MRCDDRWLISFVSRVLHHLKAFLSQAASSHEQRIETHRNILARLVALTERSQAFIKALEMEVDARYQEGTVRLCDSFARRACTVSEGGGRNYVKSARRQAVSRRRAPSPYLPQVVRC